jgi:hypothetical protein
VLQLRFIEARPACILCFAAGENVIFHFPGSNSKKNLNLSFGYEISLTFDS